MPAQSQQQQKLFGLALSVKRGETPRSGASKDVLNIVDTMTEKEIEDFAGTSHKGLPKKVEGVIREIVRTNLSESIPKMYKTFLAVQKKVRELESAQKDLLEKWKSEKDDKKKSILFDKLKQGTKVLRATRKNLSDIEEKFVNNMSYDTSYSESVNEAKKVNPTSKRFLKGMKKIKVKGLGGYMPGVDYVYVDGDKYYFVDFEGDHMELKNISTIKQLHKLHGKSLGESVNEAYIVTYTKKKGEKPASAAFQLRGSALSFEKDLKKDGYITMITQKKVKGIDESVTETINERLNTRDMKYMDGLALRKPLDTALKELRKVGQDLIDSEGFDKGDVKEFLLSKVSRVLHVGLNESNDLNKTN